MKTVAVTIEVGVEVPDDVDLDTNDGYDKALDAAALDVSTRGRSEIKESITGIEYGG